MFKKDFLWGVATASYQIEGGAFEDGRGLSVWDDYCMQDNRIAECHTGEIACDHYHRYKEDVAIMANMGVKAYRFSISWSRLIPDGIGKVNPKGLEFYNNLINELLKNGIEPYITLFHWDYPLELYKKGGWLNPESSEWFAYYAKVVAENFSDRVTNYITMNEPQCFMGDGHNGGVQAPGIKLSMSEFYQSAHNVLLSHGKAVRNLRKYAKQAIKIGYAPTYSWNYPYDENNPRDVEAAYNSNFDMPEDMDSWNVSWWSDPVFLGEYPEKGLEKVEKYLPKTWKKDLEIISEPIDFIGQNIYNGWPIRATEDGYEYVKRKIGYPSTDMGWPVTPESIKWCAKFLYSRYKLPVYITENGMSCHDGVCLDNKVHDPNRIDFMNRYLLKLEEAIDEGADVKGYFYWSFMDNFEWTNGYKKRFGLVYVDYETQERILKDSGYWYKSVIDTNGQHLHQ